MSIESHLVSLRTYLEEISSQNKEIIGLLKERGMAPQPAQATTDAFLAGTLETEPPPDAFLAAVTQDVLSKPAAAKPVSKATAKTTAKRGSK